MSKIFVFLFVLCVATGCGQISDVKAEARAKELILDVLRDPDSAKFDETFFVGGEDGELVCGRVNAKTGFGGYSGMTAFMVWQGKPYIADPMHSGEVSDCCLIVNRAIAEQKAAWDVDGFSKTCSVASTSSAMPFNFSIP
ncbi:hypothetical protein [Novilysobacter antarcticus]|uniref:hypothetical protein n=1 Tax=Novilysobacter antarcticus TaxID=2862543 RepID=UPI001C99BD32|nr:hypothetical protein [Lysobacter antarcticus]